MTDSMNAESIRLLLPEKYKGFDISVFGEVDSTNNIIRNAAKSGADEGCVCISESQTAGRGRLGRSFFSPDSTGIYMSILLRPTLKAEDAVLITTAAAVAVCKALEKENAEQPLIKWVNDIFIKNKKVCGILTESALSQNGFLEYAVLGIGINVYPPEKGFDKELKAIAGAVFDEKKENLKNRISAHIITEFFNIYKSLDKKDYFNFYKDRCFVLGREITVIKGEKSHKACALDLDNDFKLLVDYGKTKEYLSSGEISIKI